MYVSVVHVFKGPKDEQKFDNARRLREFVGKVRDGYRQDLKSKVLKICQRGVALYFIDTVRSKYLKKVF